MLDPNPLAFYRHPFAQALWSQHKLYWKETPSMLQPPRCPICFSLELKTVEHGTLCTDCEFCAEIPKPFSEWASHTHPFQEVGDSVKIPNPNSWYTKFGFTKPATKPNDGCSYSARTVQIILERQRRFIKTQSCTGFLGLPIPLGRWGETIVTHLFPAGTPHKTARGKLTIGGICRAQELDDIAELIRQTHSTSAHFIFVLDTDSAKKTAEFEASLREKITDIQLGPKGLVIKNRPLNSDFAAQRNIVQENAQTGWVLQLDCDERPDKNLLDGLGFSIAKADRLSLDSIGFPRKNLVDGALSAHYPDVQFRLNRQHIRYKKPVHETADVPWHKQSYCWLGHIEHRLEHSRLKTRSEKYEKITEGAGKPVVLQRLLMPFKLP